MSTTAVPVPAAASVTAPHAVSSITLEDFASPLEFTEAASATTAVAPEMTTTMGSTDQSSEDSGKMSLPLLLGPLFGIMLVVVLCIVAGRYRHTIRNALHKRWPQRFNAAIIIPAPATTSASTTQEAMRERRRSERRRRRHDSQRSVRTLPVYSENPGGEELVLVRKRSSSISSAGSSDAGDDHEEGGEELIRDDDRLVREASSTAASPPRTRLASDSQATLSLGQAPTYLEAMSSIDLTDSRPSFAGGTGDLEEGGRSRSKPASAFRGLISKLRPSAAGHKHAHAHSRLSSGHTSTSSLMLQPTRSNATLISPPIPHSAVRVSFDQSALPSAGLSDQQMRFLGSSEMLGLVGKPFGDGGERKARRASSSAPTMVVNGQEEMEPPSWESLERTRREDEARARVMLARPVQHESNEPDLVEASGAPAEGSETEGVNEQAGKHTAPRN